LCKSFPNLGGLLITVFLLAMTLMRLQTVQAQAEEEKKGSLGSHTTISVKIGNLKDPTKTSAILLRDRLGAEIRVVTAEEAEKYNLDFLHGVAIAWLDPIGSLTEVGLEVGDIILEINGKAIEGYEGFLDLVKSFKPHQLITFLALDHRSGHTGYVQIKAR
jgi:serine protease Do